MSGSINEITCINTIRCVSAALPQAAKSGHPGAPMGCAPIAHILFGNQMNYSPKHPDWIARDRFVLSNGHACALHYTMLYLTGYDISLDDLKQFRQLNSKTPGHPECFQTPGIEVTTGPLGQGIAQAVGLAIATESMAKRFNRPNFNLFNNFIYTVVGDGCLQEGVSSEACSLAGHLKLGRLIVFYDKNNISIDGDTDLSFTEDVGLRFKAYGWNVVTVPNADSDLSTLLKMVQDAKINESHQPTLIICHTTIGFGSLKQGTEKVHGSPLGLDDIKQMRDHFNLSSNDIFDVKQDVLDYYRQKGVSGDELYTKWCSLLMSYKDIYSTEYEELNDRINNKLSLDWMNILPQYNSDSSPDSTRALSGQILNMFVKHLPSIIGGSADLTTSNSTTLKNESDFTSIDRSGRYIRFGVREHAMAAISNGIFAFGGYRPFCATFLNFITYGWGAIRLSALSHFGILYIATHDSIELGEDGPTHQPIEVAALCRATPNLNYIRPADGNEVVGSYIAWLSYKTRPTVLALCRNAVPHLNGSSAQNVLKGGYILMDFVGNDKSRLILGSCGTELQLCVEAAKRLSNIVDIRVVSLPCWNLFEEQSQEYKLSVIPNNITSVYVEAANTLGCNKYFNHSIGMTTFGASAPKAHVWNEFGFTVDHIERVCKELSTQ